MVRGLDQSNKLTSVLSCICPVIDHEFHHDIVEVSVDPQGDSRVDPQTKYYDNAVMKFNNRAEA